MNNLKYILQATTQVMSFGVMLNKVIELTEYNVELLRSDVAKANIDVDIMSFLPKEEIYTELRKTKNGSLLQKSINTKLKEIENTNDKPRILVSVLEADDKAKTTGILKDTIKKVNQSNNNLNTFVYILHAVSHNNGIYSGHWLSIIQNCNKVVVLDSVGISEISKKIFNGFIYVKPQGDKFQPIIFGRMEERLQLLTNSDCEMQSLSLAFCVTRYLLFNNKICTDKFDLFNSFQFVREGDDYVCSTNNNEYHHLDLSSFEEIFMPQDITNEDNEPILSQEQKDEIAKINEKIIKLKQEGKSKENKKKISELKKNISLIKSTSNSKVNKQINKKISTEVKSFHINVPEVIAILHSESLFNYLMRPNKDKIFHLVDRINAIEKHIENILVDKCILKFNSDITFNNVCVEFLLLISDILEYANEDKKTNVESIISKLAPADEDKQTKLLEIIGEYIALNIDTTETDRESKSKELMEKIQHEAVVAIKENEINEILKEYKDMYDEAKISFSSLYPLGKYPRLKFDFALLSSALMTPELSPTLRENLINAGLEVIVYLFQNEKPVDKTQKIINEDSITEPSADKTSDNNQIPVVSISRQTLNGRNETINKKLKYLWQQWEGKTDEDKKFNNHEIFGNSERGEFLDDSILTNITKYLLDRESGILVLPAKSKDLIGSIFEGKQLPIECKSMSHIDQNTCGIEEHGSTYTKYSIPNNFNKSIILTTGANLNYPDRTGDLSSGNHYIAVNIRKNNNEIYFVVSDSFTNNSNKDHVNDEINNVLDNLIQEINNFRYSQGLARFNFNIINLYSSKAQQTNEENNINTCGIWAAINAVDMQNVSNEQFIKIVQQSKPNDTKLQTSIEHSIEAAEHEVTNVFHVSPTTEAPQPLVPGPLQEDTTRLAREAKIKTDALKEKKQLTQGLRSH